MEKKDKIKKYVKRIGNVLSAVAVGYIIYKFSQIEFDFKNLFIPQNILICLFLILVQISVIFTAGFPWMKFIEIITGKRVGFRKTMLVYVKANVYKYIPGNVFQYVARNELALIAEVSHVDVAMATVLDTVGCLAFALVMSLVLLGRTVVEYFHQYEENLKVVLFIGIVFLIAVAIVFLCFCRSKMAAFVNKYKACFRKENIICLIEILAYYLYNNIVNCFVFGVIFIGILGGHISGLHDMGRLMGAFVFSLIAGMITPGASGGIGIRESVMVWITESQYETSLIVAAMVWLRIISIISDLVSYVIRNIVILIKKDEISY